MEGDFIKINESLLPLSFLYGIGVKFRNMLFDIGILKSRSFDVPVISVGNITVGGTGKTPHVEYLVQLLKDEFQVAVLSRGYKRRSRGFVLADDESSMEDLGDEPYQIKSKFPNVKVAVDKDRCHGIMMLTDDDRGKNDVDVVLLDDAFQHRYVKPGISILLVDYHRLIIYDKLLPAGRLREPLSGKNRADIVIVTKCPADLRPMEYRVITKAMNLQIDTLFSIHHSGRTKSALCNISIIPGQRINHVSTDVIDDHIVLCILVFHKRSRTKRKGNLYQLIATDSEVVKIKNLIEPLLIIACLN